MRWITHFMLSLFATIYELILRSVPIAIVASIAWFFHDRWEIRTSLIIAGCLFFVVVILTMRETDIDDEVGDTAPSEEEDHDDT